MQVMSTQQNKTNKMNKMNAPDILDILSILSTQNIPIIPLILTMLNTNDPRVQQLNPSASMTAGFFIQTDTKTRTARYVGNLIH